MVRMISFFFFFFFSFGVRRRLALSLFEGMSVKVQVNAQLF